MWCQISSLVSTLYPIAPLAQIAMGPRPELSEICAAEDVDLAVAAITVIPRWRAKRIAWRLNVDTAAEELSRVPSKSVAKRA